MKKKRTGHKKCQHCGRVMSRKRFASGRHEDYAIWMRRKFCCLSCANHRQKLTKHGYSWRARKHLKLECAACGLNSRLQAHHRDGDITNNQAENIQTLCLNCHKFLHDTAQRLGATAPGSMASPVLQPV